MREVASTLDSLKFKSPPQGTSHHVKQPSGVKFSIGEVIDDDEDIEEEEHHKEKGHRRASHHKKKASKIEKHSSHEEAKRKKSKEVKSLATNLAHSSSDLVIDLACLGLGAIAISNGIISLSFSLTAF